jgi:hypothetical protein
MGLDPFDIDSDPVSLHNAILDLRGDFEAHIHDGTNSKQLENIIAYTIQARASLTAQEIVLASGGSIHLGQTSYNLGTGFWLGDVSGTPKVSVGVSGGNGFTWDGTTFSITGNLQRNDFHWFTIFESITGYGTQGAPTLNNNGIDLVTGATNGNVCEVQKVAAFFGSAFTWAKARKIRTVIKFVTNSNQTGYIVTGGGNTQPNTDRHMGFKIVNNTLYGSCADGTTQNLTAQPVYTFNANEIVNLEIRFNTTSVSFFINGTNQASLTTNLPTGTTTANFLMDLWLRTDENVAKEAQISFWDFWQAA